MPMIEMAGIVLPEMSTFEIRLHAGLTYQHEGSCNVYYVKLGVILEMLMSVLTH